MATNKKDASGHGWLRHFPPPVLSGSTNLSRMADLREFLDKVHIHSCLIRPYFEQPDYPLVDPRELLPSFEADQYEYKNLPGFSMVVLNRRLESFQEIFQFDLLHSLLDSSDLDMHLMKDLQPLIQAQNLQTIQTHLPKDMLEIFKGQFAKKNVIDLHNYTDLMPYVLEMDRAHVIALDEMDHFYLAGVYASFPSELDSEIKYFGLRLGKFTHGDNVMYERNRLFVYQYLMELYGFPIVAERRTSSALFARRLFKMGEDFMIRVLGQSDRTITTISTMEGDNTFLQVEKMALVSLDHEEDETMERLRRRGFFVDPKRRVIILKVTYQQHKYHPHNIREERALSVAKQEVIHPVTSEVLDTINVLKDTYYIFLRLNDIVRGEHQGRILYNRHELVEYTDTDEKKLKFIHYWLSKNQRRLISYSNDFYAKLQKVLEDYLSQVEGAGMSSGLEGLLREVLVKYSYINQARQVRRLEEMLERSLSNRRLNYLDMLKGFNALLEDLKFKIMDYFEELISAILTIGEKVQNNSYLCKNYIEKNDHDLTDYGREVKKQYAYFAVLMTVFQNYQESRRKRLFAFQEE